MERKPEITWESSLEHRELFKRFHADRTYLDEHDAEFRTKFRGNFVVIYNQEVVAIGKTSEELEEMLRVRNLDRIGTTVSRYYYLNEFEERAAEERTDNLFLSPRL